MTDSYDAAIRRHGVQESAVDPTDLGLTPFGTERIFRFMADRAIEKALTATTEEGPAHIVSVGAGLLVQGEMQRLEEFKRCDRRTKPIVDGVIDVVVRGSAAQLGMGSEPLPTDGLGNLKKLVNYRGSKTKELLRSVAVEAMYEPTPALLESLSLSEGAGILKAHLMQALTANDWTYQGKFELPEHVGRGRWEIYERAPISTTVLDEVTRVVGDEERARGFIDFLAGQLTAQLSGRIRPFQVTDLDARPPEVLVELAETLFEGSPFLETELYKRATSFRHFRQQAHPLDISMLADQSVTSMLVNNFH